MVCFDFSSWFTSLVLEITKAVCGLFCAPVYEEIKTTVEAIRDPQSLHGDADKLMQLLNEIRAMSHSAERDKWIKEADETIHQVNQLRQPETSGSSSSHNDDRQSSCLCLSSGGDACSRCNLHRNIKKLIARGEIIKLPALGRKPVEPIDGGPIIGDGTTADINLKRVMDTLDDDDVWCIGVWGPGGVGKTTLAKALNNKLAKGKSSFSLVRLIELKANDGERGVQEAIGKSLGLSIGEGIEDRIRNTLQREKFLLILDNLWKSIDLPTIGIPERWKGSKIILTTRSRKVCTRMDGKEIEVKYLKEEEAWQLFAEKVGRGVVNNKEIEPLAKEVCKECGYLPLALVVVGSAMKGETNIIEWRNAVNKLRSSVPMDDEIESKVYNPLKLSYDSLDDNLNLKACFLYCSLYPEGYFIEINELVECWVAENLIDEGLYYTEAYNMGLGLINKLMESCLIEEVWGKHTPRVKMHDVVRDVARWIGKSMKKSVVFSGYGVSLRPNVILPEEVENFRWVSFVDNKEIKLPEYEKDYSSVTTLQISGTSWNEKLEVSTEFLRGFRTVKVLKMKDVQSFTASPLQLEELQALILRRCSDIDEVPNANNLKILDLSDCHDLCNIPRKKKQLSNLRVLNLFSTSRLERIDADTILNMKSLEILNMIRSGYKWPARKRSESEGATLQDLSRLPLLREVYLQLAETDVTFEECRWMERLQRFLFAYGYYSGEPRRKTISIEKGTRIGSFILHAETLRLDHGNQCTVSEVFYNFSWTDEYNSKLKELKIMTKLGTKDAETIPKYSVVLNVEELSLESSASASCFREITYALGANFPKLKRLILWGLEYVFSSDDLHIVLPELQYLFVENLRGRRVFECKPVEIQAIAPKLRILEVATSLYSESLCYFEPNDEWTSLEILDVDFCPKLKEFPLMPSIKEIRGYLDWWNTVHWRSEETKSCYKGRSIDHRWAV